MLLLPLLIVWAPNPMHFSRKLRRSVVSSVVLIALTAPLGYAATSHANERLGPLQRLRSAEASLGAPQGNRLAFAETRADPKRINKLREGTLVPPTTGRFIPVGRQWAFVPDEMDDQNADLANSGHHVRNHTMNRFRSVSTRTGKTPKGFVLGALRNRLREAVPPIGIPAPVEQSDLYQLTTADLIAPTDTAPNPLSLKRLMVIENLTLQRVVEAIRIDSSDDHWTISGEVTEFFEENRLLLRTAERSTTR